MSSYVLGFQDIDKTKIMVVGGKGANLGELSRIEGIRVPDGFCISTEAFTRIIGQAPSIHELLDQLARLKVEDRQKIGELSAEIRRVIEGIAIPEDIQEAITRSLSRLGEENAYAVRSSATAEDLPAASFAGQQDTYLNIIGKQANLEHISKCCLTGKLADFCQINCRGPLVQGFRMGSYALTRCQITCRDSNRCVCDRI
jgi:phosphoenolpyruvate synthase/pyruvate phosphate dikinase